MRQHPAPPGLRARLAVLRNKAAVIALGAGVGIGMAALSGPHWRHAGQATPSAEWYGVERAAWRCGRICYSPAVLGGRAGLPGGDVPVQNG